MSAVLEPQLLLHEALCCAALGAALGAVRAFWPAKGRAAFVPDMLLVGALLMLTQSFAAGASGAGTLRWYMLAGAASGALLAQKLLSSPLGAARARSAALAAAFARFLRQNILPAAQKRRSERILRAKERLSEKKSAKKRKNTLQKQQHLLYNSNV